MLAPQVLLWITGADATGVGTRGAADGARGVVVDGADASGVGIKGVV